MKKNVEYLNAPAAIIDEIKEDLPNVDSLAVMWVTKDGNFSIRYSMMPDEAPLFIGITEVLKQHIIDTCMKE